MVAHELHHSVLRFTSDALLPPSCCTTRRTVVSPQMKYMVAGMLASIQALESLSRSRLSTPAFIRILPRRAAQCA